MYPAVTLAGCLTRPRPQHDQRWAAATSPQRLALLLIASAARRLSGWLCCRWFLSAIGHLRWVKQRTCGYSMYLVGSTTVPVTPAPKQPPTQLHPQAAHSDCFPDKRMRGSTSWPHQAAPPAAQRHTLSPKRQSERPRPFMHDRCVSRCGLSRAGCTAQSPPRGSPAVPRCPVAGTAGPSRSAG